jgi:hypothetical protein
MFTVCTYNFDMLQVLGYPSKPIGLLIKRSIIFRSDSNGEDLEGYAGAGLYDRYNNQKTLTGWISNEFNREEGTVDSRRRLIISNQHLKFLQNQLNLFQQLSCPLQNMSGRKSGRI